MPDFGAFVVLPDVILYPLFSKVKDGPRCSETFCNKHATLRAII